MGVTTSGNFRTTNQQGLPMGRTHTFTDWANQSISYRVRAAKPSEVGEPGAWLVCEINPHGDAWQALGRAKTAAEAVKEAISSWNEYDRERG